MASASLVRIHTVLPLFLGYKMGQARINAQRQVKELQAENATLRIASEELNSQFQLLASELKIINGRYEYMESVVMKLHPIIHPYGCDCFECEED